MGPRVSRADVGNKSLVSTDFSFTQEITTPKATRPWRTDEQEGDRERERERRKRKRGGRGENK